VLIGVRRPEGLGYVTPPLPIDEEFVTLVADSGGDAEQRFRFSEPCVERGCAQWKDEACGLIGRLLASPAPADPVAQANDLPACGIRPRCRWFHQEGANACTVCPSVITDNTAGLVPIALDLSDSSREGASSPAVL
jgi:hypothetical protein